MERSATQHNDPGFCWVPLRSTQPTNIFFSSESLQYYSNKGEGTQRNPGKPGWGNPTPTLNRRGLLVLKVFVYGTLKPGEENYLSYCGGKVVETLPALAMGKLFALPQGYPAMTLGDSAVYGYLLSFADGEVLNDLDELEDYQPSRQKSKNLYNRQQIEIFDLKGDVTTLPPYRSLGLAWTYLMEASLVYQLGGTPQDDGWWSGCGIAIHSIFVILNIAPTSTREQ